MFRGSQLTAELLVIGITWWYTYHSYRIRRGIDLGITIDSLLLYNGSLYFFAIASLYIFHIVCNTAPVPEEVSKADTLLSTFYDPITSILVSRFLLSLRQFDRNVASTSSEMVFKTATFTVLKFGAHSSEQLPMGIATFAHPVHAHSSLPEMDEGAILRDDSEGQEMCVSTILDAQSSGQVGPPPASEYQA